MYGGGLDKVGVLRVERVHAHRAADHAAALKVRRRRKVLHGAAAVPVAVLGLPARKGLRARFT